MSNTYFLIMKIYLGKVKSEIESSQSYTPEENDLYILGEDLYIEKHSWDCNWYWGFGYIGNDNMSVHAEVFIHELLWHSKDTVFENSIFKNDDDFWIFKDLLKQAYALKECAEVYQNGGHCITSPKTGIIKSKTKAKTINRDLEKVLDELWKFLKKLDTNTQ